MAKLELTEGQIEFLEEELNKEGILFESVQSLDMSVIEDLIAKIREEENDGPYLELNEAGDDWIYREGSPNHDCLRHHIALDIYEELITDKFQSGDYPESDDDD